MIKLKIGDKVYEVYNGYEASVYKIIDETKTEWIINKKMRDSFEKDNELERLDKKDLWGNGNQFYRYSELAMDKLKTIQKADKIIEKLNKLIPNYKTALKIIKHFGGKE